MSDLEGEALLRWMNRYGLLGESRNKLDYVLVLWRTSSSVAFRLWIEDCTNGARMAGSVHGLQQTEANIERYIKVQEPEQGTISNGGNNKGNKVDNPVVGGTDMVNLAFAANGFSSNFSSVVHPTHGGRPG
ncbi:ribosomal protein [Corchorus olitorius]|uniref:Ribosomal protein n=1 Tax=Corchorus olitorius TaxID=93759 RepID=A0A1R3J6L1_9ROSI|nr:ribosomal protein [Corchorus olitorius]